LTEQQLLEVRRVHASELHEVRRRVLRGDNPDTTVADPRDEEPSALHIAGFLGTRLVVTSSWYPSVPAMNPHLQTYQLRYMATDFDVQGRGYGSVVLEAAEAALRELGAEQVWANGRDTALGFYRATGWQTVEGSEHLSPETQLPHTVIYKLLT
jgi:GNAT superfamily N-acetyltransferase